MKEQKPFSFLDNIVNILLADNDSKVVAHTKKVLSPVSMFSIQTAPNAKSTQSVLTTPERIHLCIHDLGLKDINNDEFHILKEFAQRVSFIILTDSTSPLKGFLAHSFGARVLLEKPIAFDRTFLKTINYYALLNIINPLYKSVRDTLSRSTDILFEKSPDNVSQWAIQTGISDRELRHIWTKRLGANAKIILSIYQLFTSAFGYYEKKQIVSASLHNVKIEETGNYKRLEEYFHMHRSTIMDFIAFGNVIQFLSE